MITVKVAEGFGDWMLTGRKNENHHNGKTNELFTCS